ncbi:hypothetical protein [Mycobacteroides abscessus]|uniref:hypothetical protein n=1 Tax=Mycobacteroides abscessus TaxID=36809 RepID=UPI000386548E|nr:hypothetical protein [Mycobacteroides abscessus]EPZ18837.1 hypothetical protein M879_19750 [Mycobacteroides abscessus V06705]MDO3267867.1 hypothetical protein [Mycobacteroides abscessus subsp. abscessus]
MGELSELDLSESAELHALADTMFLQVPLEDKHAAALADVMSQIMDIAIAREYADGYVERALDPDVVADDWTLAALWSAMLITYRRAFASGSTLVKKGTRFRGLNEVIPDQLPSDLAAIHEELLGFANRHIAHRVDDKLEWTSVAAGLTAWPLPRAYVGIRVEPARIVCPEIWKVAQLSRLCSTVLSALSELFHERFSDAGSHYKNMDIDVLYRRAHRYPEDDTSTTRITLANSDCHDSLTARVAKVLHPLLCSER